MNLDLAAPFAAILSASVALFSGGQALVKTITPPPISGVVDVRYPAVPGASVMVDWIISKRSDCPGEFSRVWDGALNFHLSEPQRATSLPVTNGPQQIRIPTTIPAVAPLGELVLTVHGYLDCPNMTRQWFVLGPVNFDVIATPPAAQTDNL